MMSNKENTYDLHFKRNLQLLMSQNRLHDLFTYLLQNICETSIDGIWFQEAAIFILNKDFYEFELRMCNPIEQRKNILELYETMVENGTIGKMIDSGEVLIYSNEIQSIQKNCLLAPLITDNGVIGMFIMISNSKISIESFKNKEFDDWLILNSFRIENILFQDQLEKSKKLLEQRMAASTIQIMHSKKVLETILNSVKVGIIVINPVEEKILMTNPTTLKLVQYDEEDLIGQNPLLLFRNTEDTDFDKKKNIEGFESTIYNSRNVPIPVLRNISNIRFNEQKFRIESFIDITEQKMNQIALKQSRDVLELKVQERTEDLQIMVEKMKKEVIERQKAEAEAKKMLVKEQELNDLKTQFVSLVNREFRTPMTFIRTAAQLLGDYRDQMTEKQIANYTESIISSVDNMSELMQNVLNFENETNAEYQFVPVKNEMGSFVESIITEPVLQNRKIERLDVINNVVSETIVFDDVLIRNILINLIANALKYSPDDTSVVLKIDETDSTIVFSVSDKGIGIHQDEVNKIFERFYRGSNVGLVSGSGLGLSTVKKCVDVHKGKLEVESELNEGTTLRVIISK